MENKTVEQEVKKNKPKRRRTHAKKKVEGKKPVSKSSEGANHKPKRKVAGKKPVAKATGDANKKPSKRNNKFKKFRQAGQGVEPLKPQSGANKPTEVAGGNIFLRHLEHFGSKR